MPLTTRTGMRHSKGSGERQFPCGALSFFPRNDGGSTSYPFTVNEEPLVLVACIANTHSVQLQVSPDDGASWVDVYVHSEPVQLTATNNLLYLPLVGKYRLVYTGSPIGRVTGQPNTLTHEAALPLVSGKPDLLAQYLLWGTPPPTETLANARVLLPGFNVVFDESVDGELTVHTGSGSEVVEQPMGRVYAYLGDDTAYTGSDIHKINFSLEAFDTLDEYDRVTAQQFVALSAGFYVAQLNVSFKQTNSAARYLRPIIYKNGGLEAQSTINDGIVVDALAQTDCSVLAFMQLNAGDTLEGYFVSLNDGVIERGFDYNVGTRFQIWGLPVVPSP